MKIVSLVVAVSLGLLATLATASGAAADGRSHGRGAGGRFGAGHSSHSHGHSVHKHGHSFRTRGHSFHNRGHSFHNRGHSFHNRGHSFHKRGFGHHRVSPRHFVTFGLVVAPPVFVNSSPPVFHAPPPYYGAPVYVPPTVYGPPALSQPAPAPPPPRVVEYPTGRYELRGDGISTPYTWVWIPNPPPPPAAPPPAPPAGAPMSGGPPPVRHTQVYRWVDEQGVVHWTDRQETVPRRYREEGKRLKPS